MYGVEGERAVGDREGREERRSGIRGTKGQQVLCHRARLDPASSGALLPDCESRGSHPPHACFCTSDVTEIWLALSRLSGNGLCVERRQARRGRTRCRTRMVVGTGLRELARAYGQKRQEEERFCFPVTFIWVQGDVGFSFCISQACLCASRGTVI